MTFFRSPPPSRLDLNFTLLGFPIRIHPFFWLIAILFGYAGSDLIRLVIWVAVVFVSITVHELGHAVAYLRYGIDSSIVLYGMGGLTIPGGARLGGSYARISPRGGQQVVISLAGPVAGFMLAAITILLVIALGGSVSVRMLAGILPIPVAFVPVGGAILNTVVGTMLWVNIFWGLINLLPVFPLDGGRVMRAILSEADPLNGVRRSLWVSVIAGAAMAILGLLLLRSIYMAFLFGFLAYQSFTVLQGQTSRPMF